MPKKPASQESAPTADPAADSSTGGDVDFEAALAELEELVDEMEAGDMTLEASLKAFERGVKLTRQCQAALRNAELKVKQLTKDNELEALDPDQLDDD